MFLGIGRGGNVMLGNLVVVGVGVEGVLILWGRVMCYLLYWIWGGLEFGGG